MDLTIRPRRLRTSDTLRRMVRETRVSPDLPPVSGGRREYP